jgi:DNA-binding IclR family transcriptional regulator
VSPLSEETETKKASSPARRTEDAFGPILFAISEAEHGIGVRELARSLDISKSVVGRVLTGLTSSNVVSYDEERQHYRLGHGVVELASSYRRANGIYAAAETYLNPLRDSTGETICVSIINGHFRVPIFQAESRSELRYSANLGEPDTLSRGSSARVLLSQLDEAGVRSLLEAEELSEAQLDEILQRRREVLESGFDVSRGERNPGGTAVAVPLSLDEPHAVGLYAPDFRLPDERVAEIAGLLRGAADSIRRELFGDQRRNGDEP